MEFLNLKASPEFYEKDIEQGIIEHLKDFLLELGRGFSFVARQKHIYASKYLPYLPTEEELRQELRLDRLPPSTGA